MVDSFELPPFNCQLSSLGAQSIADQDRIAHVHGKICEITNTRVDAGIKACSSDYSEETSNDGKTKNLLQWKQKMLDKLSICTSSCHQKIKKNYFHFLQKFNISFLEMQ